MNKPGAENPFIYKRKPKVITQGLTSKVNVTTFTLLKWIETTEQVLNANSIINNFAVKGP